MTDALGPAACSHMSVEYRTRVFDGYTTGWWECLTCKTIFSPHSASTDALGPEPMKQDYPNEFDYWESLADYRKRRAEAAERRVESEAHGAHLARKDRDAAQRKVEELRGLLRECADLLANWGAHGEIKARVAAALGEKS